MANEFFFNFYSQFLQFSIILCSYFMKLISNIILYIPIWQIIDFNLFYFYSFVIQYFISFLPVPRFFIIKVFLFLIYFISIFIHYLLNYEYFFIHYDFNSHYIYLLVLKPRNNFIQIPYCFLNIFLYIHLLTKILCIRNLV